MSIAQTDPRHPLYQPTPDDRRQASLAAAAMRALEARDQFRSLSGPALITLATAMIADTQATLARLSGLTPNTITALKQGKRPTAAQRAAIAWAVFERWT